MNSEAHNICGLVVHLAAHCPQTTPALIRAMSGVDVHAQSEDGRLVLTVEDSDNGLAIDQIAAIHRLPGVVSATLAYHALDLPEPATTPCTCGGGGDCAHAAS